MEPINSDSSTRTRSLSLSKIFSRSGISKRSVDQGPQTKKNSLFSKSQVPEIKRKIVFVGDAACGKTSFLSCASKGIMLEVVPTNPSNHIIDIELDGREVEVSLWDSASYLNTHSICLCFSLTSPSSLTSAQEKYLPEILHNYAGLPILLLGLKKDLRSDPTTIEELINISQHPVSWEEVRFYIYNL